MKEILLSETAEKASVKLARMWSIQTYVLVKQISPVVDEKTVIVLDGSVMLVTNPLWEHPLDVWCHIVIVCVPPELKLA
jgi:hypothetical protein